MGSWRHCADIDATYRRRIDVREMSSRRHVHIGYFESMLFSAWFNYCLIIVYLLKFVDDMSVNYTKNSNQPHCRGKQKGSNCC